MLALRIEKLKIVVETSAGVFSVLLPFKPGLNIVRAENSSGKSTCVNAIAYGLGLEAILGPSRRRPFPKSLYEVILNNKKEEKPYFVEHSYVAIEVCNAKDRIAVLTRDVLGDSNKVTVQENEKELDYFLGSSGHVGSARTERGFHYWLANFLGWDLPTVVTHEDKESLLYLECIFPLFFIEQKRGWSEIQANSPSHYGIKNVKKAAAEYCLAIEAFEREKQISHLKKMMENAEIDWDKLQSSVESIAAFNSVTANELARLTDKDNKNYIQFKYCDNEASISVEEQERSLERLVRDLERDLEDAIPQDDRHDEQNAIVRSLQRESADVTRNIEILFVSLEEVNSKLNVLEKDHLQYQQLKRLQDVGSDINADMELGRCPLCENELYDTLSPSSAKRQPMTLEENLEFLKNQIDFYRAIKNKSEKRLQKLQHQADCARKRLSLETEKLRGIQADLDEISGATKILIREKIQAEATLKEVKKLKDHQKKINEDVIRIRAEWSNASNALKIMRKELAVTDAAITIMKLQGLIRSNLQDFKFKTSAINTISVSKQSLRPEQEGYDIVAETSASDYIRIIWAYTLALLELASKEEKVRHSGFVVFDEPRQHEASKISFTSFIKKAASSAGYGGQVILATSLEEDGLRGECDKANANLVCFDDYILTLAEDSES